MDEVAELVALANSHYREGYRLTDLKKYDEAIDQYSKAIQLIPSFYEAIDNRAFCKMDTGRWDEAIADFQLSLMINPTSFLATFSIGECLFKLHDFKNAVIQFEKAVLINPMDQLALNFLKVTKEKIAQSL